MDTLIKPSGEWKACKGLNDICETLATSNIQSIKLLRMIPGMIERWWTAEIEISLWNWGHIMYLLTMWVLRGHAFTSLEQKYRNTEKQGDRFRILHSFAVAIIMLSVTNRQCEQRDWNSRDSHNHVNWTSTKKVRHRSGGKRGQKEKWNRRESVFTPSWPLSLSIQSTYCN